MEGSGFWGRWFFPGRYLFSIYHDQQVIDARGSDCELTESVLGGRAGWGAQGGGKAGRTSRELRLWLRDCRGGCGHWQRRAGGNAPE